VCLPGGDTTFDTAIRFGGASGRLYAGILRADAGNLAILRGTFPPPGLMTVLVDRSGPDQPWAMTSWPGGPSGNRDRVYITSNDTRATAEFSLDAAAAAPPAGFGAPLVIDPRAGGNRPSVRSAPHLSGTAYACFVHTNAGSADIVVVRDDAWGTNSFADLVDPGDGVAGRHVAVGVTIPAVGTLLGTQRVSSRIAIAVDPNRRRRVFLAWYDGTPGSATTPFTLRVRRSDDGGTTWTGDLRTVQNVTNPCLGVNVGGTVALLYQQLTGTAPNQTWQTILERSTDGFATVATSNTLANVPPGNVFGAAGPLGDYCNLIAVGKDFYGAFSARNAPVNANFPSGVTYLRNANFATGNLRNVADTANVSVSTDPFFVHWQTVERKDDLFVRDWTDGPGVADDGVEPALRSHFYVTSDVWNRRSTTPGSFPSDQPENEPAGNGAGLIGDNWLFARIRRRAPAPSGAPALDATAHFLVSKLGTGSNFADASSSDPDLTFFGADPTVSFAAADVGPAQAGPQKRHLSPVSSTHLCIAVEVSSPGDPFAGSSLRGRAPGWPDTDVEILNDNNKAQRNLGLSTTPAFESGESLLWAIVHNAAAFTRDLKLRISLDPSINWPPNVVVELLPPDRRPLNVRRTGELTLKTMRAGENRWIGLRLVGKLPASVALVHLEELVGSAAVNGFALGVRVAEGRAVRQHLLERWRSVTTRVAHGFSSDPEKALRALTPNAGAVPDRDLFDRLLAALPNVNPGPTDVAELAKRLVPSRRIAVRSLLSVLESIDALITSIQLTRGDASNIAQTFRRQEALFSGLVFFQDGSARELTGIARRFDSDFAKRSVDPDDAPKTLATCAVAFDRLGRGHGIPGLGAEVERAASLDTDLDAFQLAHARLLDRFDG